MMGVSSKICRRWRCRKISPPMATALFILLRFVSVENRREIVVNVGAAVCIHQLFGVPRGLFPGSATPKEPK